jgi:hypothetical protein
MAMELNKTHKLLVHIDVNLLGKNINITKILLDAIKKASLEINTKKTKYMFMSHHQITWQDHYIKVHNKSF